MRSLQQPMSAGRIDIAMADGVVTVTICNPRRLNAMSRAMWRALKAVFERIQDDHGARCVLLRGADGHFCAGGDIAEYPEFRFDAASLRAFHEEDVWGALRAMLECDVPMLAAIEGHCMGAGIELACCCDLRMAAADARFGAPIARLGFPMAPREDALVARVAGEPTLRQLLLEAAVLDADEMKARGFLHELWPASELMDRALQRARRVAALAPRAARLNKRTLRTLNALPAQSDQARAAMNDLVAGAYDYADSAEHREGIAAFLDKRPSRHAVSSISRPRTPPMPNQNLYAALRAAFPAELDGRAVETDSGLVYSWRDLERASAMVANLLQSLDLPSDPTGMPPRVAVQVDKSVEAMILYLATLRAGFVFLPLNTAYHSGEIEYFIGNARPAVVVCTGANFPWVSQIAFKAGTRHVFTLDDDRTGSLLERATHCSDRQVPVDCSADRLAAIVYTSGTTGRSKGAMLSHGNLLSNAAVLKDYWGWRTGDVLIHALPIFHVHGLFVAIHGALLNGSPMLWHGKFDPRHVIADLPRATVFMGVPTLYTRMLAEPSLTQAQCAHMRLFISGSAPLLIETFNEWRARTGHTILERYGMSETIMLTSNPYRADARHGGQDERRGGTVGFPLPGVSLRVQDDAGKTLAAGQIGGIQVKGPNVFAGYWQMPDKTAEEFTADGFFKTGDVGMQDARGYVTIVGRSKDMIISGGYNVYPAEIEGILNELAGVQESAVVGVPHPDFGEVGVAVIIPRPGAAPQPQALLDELKARLANYKIPKRCFVETELPRNTMGKVQKNLLRERYKGLFA